MSKIRKKSLQEIQESKPSIVAIRQKKRLPLVLIVDSIRSLYNIGSFFRTGDAILIEKIYLCGISGSPPDAKIEKVALGATNVVPFEYFSNVKECISNLKDDGYYIYALELTDMSHNYANIDYRFPAALIVGNEVEGVSDEALKMTDQAIDIPMKGRANSLNVATAFAVVAYQIHNNFYGNKT
ncbi:TrmH family RNA methyltransferase [Candidatus Peregrinibacteria bacterium]|nr:TrmH family RNA methyltransferase [Candidatus Peregrinibacteria bacterium]